MKTVVTTKQVAHLWANMAQPTARNSNNSASFDGTVLRSYSRVIGRQFRGFVAVSNTGYSATTRRHEYNARQALRGLPLRVVEISEFVPEHSADIVSTLISDAQKYMRDAVKFRADWKIGAALAAARRCWEDAKFIDPKTKIPALDINCLRAAEKSRQADIRAMYAADANDETLSLHQRIEAAKNAKLPKLARKLQKMADMVRIKQTIEAIPRHMRNLSAEFAKARRAKNLEAKMSRFQSFQQSVIDHGLRAQYAAPIELVQQLRLASAELCEFVKPIIKKCETAYRVQELRYLATTVNSAETGNIGSIRQAILAREKLESVAPVWYGAKPRRTVADLQNMLADAKREQAENFARELDAPNITRAKFSSVRREYGQFSQSYGEIATIREKIDTLSARFKESEVSDWLRGENVPAPAETMFRLRNGEIESSRGARVPIEAGARLWRLLKTGIRKTWPNDGPHIGPFTLRAIDDAGIVVGCHRFTHAEAERFAKVMSWE